MTNQYQHNTLLFLYINNYYKKIKTQLVKRLTNELIKKHGPKFKTEFEKNKEVVAKYTSNTSKKIRDVISFFQRDLYRMVDLLG